MPSRAVGPVAGPSGVHVLGQIDENLQMENIGERARWAPRPAGVGQAQGEPRAACACARAVL